MRIEKCKLSLGCFKYVDIENLNNNQVGRMKNSLK